MGTVEAFITGYENGEDGKPELTPAEVCEKNPTLTAAGVDAFLQGWEDGHAGDTFRVNLIHEQERGLV